MSALGLVETAGLLAAVECADAMLKTADVRLLERHLVGAGLVTVTVSGEVAAVRAAVDAGMAAVRALRVDALVSAHVIARPDSELGRVVAVCPGSCGGPGTPIIPAGPSAPAEPAASGAVAAAAAGPPVHDISRLKKMSLARLRDLARETDGLAMTREALSSARKNDLIQALLKAYRQEEE